MWEEACPFVSQPHAPSLSSASCSLPSEANQPIVCRLLIAGSVSSECSGKAVCSDFLCREGGDLLGCSVGGLPAGSTASRLRCRGEGIPALLDQLCGDGFCGDPEAEASLGPLTRCQNRRTITSASVLAKSVCRLTMPAASQRSIRIRCSATSGRG